MLALAPPTGIDTTQPLRPGEGRWAVWAFTGPITREGDRYSAPFKRIGWVLGPVVLRPEVDYPEVDYGDRFMPLAPSSR